MVETSYTIKQLLTSDLIAEIASQSTQTQSPQSGPNGVTFWFDHTPAQALTFKKWLVTKLGLYNDAISKYTTFNASVTIWSTTTPVVLTNIGTTFKNLFTRSDGMSFGIDIDVYDTIRLQVHWTRAAGDTGVHSLQVVDKSTPTNVLASISNLATGSNLGSAVTIPAIFLNTKNLYLIQVKSTVAADDPTFEGINIYIQ